MTYFNKIFSVKDLTNPQPRSHVDNEHVEAEEVCFVSGFVTYHFDEYIVRLDSE